MARRGPLTPLPSKYTKTDGDRQRSQKSERGFQYENFGEIVPPSGRTDVAVQVGEMSELIVRGQASDAEKKAGHWNWGLADPARDTLPLLPHRLRGGVVGSWMGGSIQAGLIAERADVE